MLLLGKCLQYIASVATKVINFEWKKKGKNWKLYSPSGTELENTIYVCIANTRCGIFQLQVPLYYDTWDNVPRKKH
jgi:hypothetical protein